MTSSRPTLRKEAASATPGSPARATAAHLPTIDLHTHILPPSLPDMRARTGYGGWVTLERDAHGTARMLLDGRPFRDVAANLWDVGARLEDMDRSGVDAQALSTVPVMFAYRAQPEHALEWARLLNDHIASVVRERPRRFAGLGTIPLQDADLAVGELERCVRDLCLAGVQVGSNVDGRDLDDASLFPVLEAAAALDAAVFVHPWDMLGQERMTRYWLPWLVGMPAETTLAICSVILGGVLDRLPTLRIGFAHGGGAFPGTFGRIEHGFHARPDLVAVNDPGPPASYLGRFWVDSLVHDVRMLELIVERFGAGHVALGSDYPFPLGEEVPGTLIDALPGAGEDVRRSLRAGAAIAFLGSPARALAGAAA